MQTAMMALSMLINTSLFLTICCSSRLRSTTHAFIASLAASDIIISIHGIIYCIISSLTHESCYRNDRRWTRSLTLFIKFITATNYLNILLVSIERWLYIAQPFLHQRLFSRRVTVCGLLTAWLLPLIINIDILIVPDSDFEALINVKLTTEFPIIYFVVCFVLCSIYVHLALILRYQIRAISKTRPAGVFTVSNQNESVRTFNVDMVTLKENWKCVRLLVTVFGAFFLLMTPGISLHIYEGSVVVGLYYPHIRNICNQLTYFHSCVNFFVFAAQDKEFRHILSGYIKRVVCGNVPRCSEKPCSRCRVEPMADTTNKTRLE